MKIERIINGKWVENCYIVSSNTSAVIVDPGGNTELIKKYVEDHSLQVVAIINTHAHFDHIVAVAELANFYNCPFHLHSGDARLLRSANLYMALFLGEEPITVPKVDIWLDKTTLPLVLNDLSIEVFHTPGHTDGSVCFLIGEHLFTGDTLMKGELGRIDLPGGNKEKLVNSLHTLSKLPGNLVIYPGHGETSSLAEEYSSNEPLLNLIR
ncbi:MAG: MBL fold metallo-hydrolase [Bacteroidota bacterium]